MDASVVLQFDLQALRRIVARVLQLSDDDVIFANQPAPVGKHAFVTLRDLTAVTIGSEYKFDAKAEMEYITDTKETTISVNAYGANAFLLLCKLNALLKTSAAVSDLRRAQITIPRISPIRNLTAALAGGYEERAQMDLTVSHIHRLKTGMKRAETVEITVTKD